MEKDVQIKIGKFEVSSLSVATANVISEKGPFLLREVLIPEDVARYFMLTDVKVGRNSQFVSPGAVPADFFAGELAGKRQEGLCYDILPRGSRLTLNVSNLSKDARDFEAVLVGDVMQEDEFKDSARGRRVFMGLGNTPLSGRSSALVSIQPQVVVRPDFLFVPSSVLDGLEVAQVRAVGVKVDTPTEKKGEVVLDSPLMQIADWLTVDVENKTDTQRNFQGVVVGELGELGELGGEG